MGGRVALPPMSEEGKRAVVPLGFVRGLLDTIEKPMIVAERSGNLLLVNNRAKQFLESHGYATTRGLNLFNDLLRVDALKIFGAIEKGEHEMDLHIQRGEEKSTARGQWMPESDWLVVEICYKWEALPGPGPGSERTVQELLQGGQITSRTPLG